MPAPPHVQRETRSEGIPAAVFLGGDLYRHSGFRANHPLAIPRIAAVLDLCAALDWLPPQQHRECPQASFEQLCEFHDPGYVEALRRSDRNGRVEIADRERYAIGTMENPVSPGLFERAASAVGGSILAADLALQGHRVFHPAGGMHHGRPDRASGFCFFNDPVFTLRRLAHHGLTRIAYVDLDAHHCDGVQDAVRTDPRMHTLSIHEAGRWPHTGAADDQGGGRSVNLPVPGGFNDSELAFLMAEVVRPWLAHLQPQAVVVACGTDALAGDPLSSMKLSNGALWDAVLQTVEAAPAAAVLGGGGYNPWTLARCWTGLWGRLSGRPLPARLPTAATDLLRVLQCDLIEDDEIDPEWLSSLADAPRPGPVREDVRRLAESAACGPQPPPAFVQGSKR